MRWRWPALTVIADRLLGARAGDIMGLVSIISLAASISAMTFAGPRVYSDPGPSGAGLLVIAAGVPLYLILGRRRERSPHLAQV